MTPKTDHPTAMIDIEAIREMASSGHAREIWQNFDTLVDNGQLVDYLKEEYPRQGSLAHQISRRDFLKVMGASLAFAGLSACAPRSTEKIYPYVKPPEELIPGQPLSFASTMTMDGYAQGVVVTSNMGRPIKVDGNPKHPATLGASDVFIQASILDLYDPERAQELKNQGAKKSWGDFTAALSQPLTGQTASQGAGLRILTGIVTSPTLKGQILALLKTYPNAKWHAYSPVGRGQEYSGAQQAFGEVVDTHYDFSKASIVLSLDADFMFRQPGHIRYSRDFEAHHQVTTEPTEVNRLYVVESSLTLTGSNADHRLPVQAWQVETFARALADRLGIAAGTVDTSNLPGSQWLDPLVSDLRNHPGGSIVLPGDRQPSTVHALAHAINQALGNVGQTVFYTDPVEANPVDPVVSLKGLVDDLDAGQVDLLFILDTNPVYSAPADLHFADSVKKAKLVVYQGLYEDETASVAHWFIPAHHYLETWSDARAFDGTASIIQPLIDPLYAGKSVHEVIAALQGQPDAKAYDLVRSYWQRQLTGGNFEQAWEQSLSDGVVANTTLPARPVTLNASLAFPPATTSPGDSIEVVFEPDPTIWDGRFSNNAWLQELPKPLTKLTWDNAILVSASLANKLGVSDEDLVEIRSGDRRLTGPVLVQPGQPEKSITLSLGYGRRRGDVVPESAGYSAYTLRTSATPWFFGGVEVRKTGQKYRLATTRDHQTMEGRNLVHSATIEQFRQDHNLFASETGRAPSLYPEVAYPGHAWGMAINLNTCIGCNACVLACQAENNIPVVGKDQVERSREMHWLRVDRYFQDAAVNSQVAYQPVPCMHCETAPCEVVCPVEATSHSAEGINEMTYNRCVGTRYCSNNCPYKVRRFNFYDYSNPAESLKGMRNPDVTVRPRGVMEKCNYCVQRVNRARIREQIEGKPIQDGEVKTACQQACPTNAIIFGDINDANSQVRKLKEQPQNYALLSELNTKPRTTYLARFRNPNPQISE